MGSKDQNDSEKADEMLFPASIRKRTRNRQIISWISAEREPLTIEEIAERNNQSFLKQIDSRGQFEIEPAMGERIPNRRPVETGQNLMKLFPIRVSFQTKILKIVFCAKPS
jgi:hypothetical protein